VNAKEYLKTTPPAFKRSRLAPYWNDIAQLRGRDYTLGQVREFLVNNGVQISIAGLSQYINRREMRCGKRVATETPTRPQIWNSVSAAKVELANTLNGVVSSGNPLRVLSGSRNPSEFSALPAAKIEFN